MGGMRALSAHPYGCGCVEGLSCKMRVPRHPRASTVLTPTQLSPTSLWRSVRSSSLFSEGEGVITQTVTWVASGAPAKGRTSFWQGPTALWDEEHARQSHQASECAGGEFEIPAPGQLLHYPQGEDWCKIQVFPFTVSKLPHNSFPGTCTLETQSNNLWSPPKHSQILRKVQNKNPPKNKHIPKRVNVFIHHSPAALHHFSEGHRDLLSTNKI